MKKVILSLAVISLLSSSALFAQKYNEDALKAKIQKSNSDIADAKKNAKAATWVSRGDMFADIAAANSKLMFVGMAEADLILAAGKPMNADNILSENLNGVDYKKFEYPGVNVYISTDKSEVALWIETKPVEKDAIEKAIEAYNKALELDAKYKDKVAEGYKNIVNFLSIEGQNFYDAGKYKEAADFFAKSANYDYKNPNGETSNPDDLLYYAAVASTQGEDYENASKYIQQLIDKGVEKEGDIYYYAGIVFDKVNRKDDAKKYLGIGVEKFLENPRVLQQFIAFQLTNNASTDEVLPYIIKAQENDPKNPNYFVAEGFTYDQIKDYEKSVIAYQKAIDIDPNNFGALYSLGYAYRAQAIKINDELTKTDYTNKTRIEELNSKFIETMKKAIIPFEKAHEVNPNEKNVVEVLKSIYFVLRDSSPEMLEKYNKYNDLVKTM